MDKLTLYMPLTASAEDRTLSGLLLPFNEPGFTNLGRITASADTQLDVADMVVLNRQHNRDVPLGKAVTLHTDPAQGVQAAFHVLGTRDGDDALLEASEGVRNGLSVELEPCVVRGGKLISGTIVAAGHVVAPAFASARLAAADAVTPDMGGQPTDPTVPAVVIDGQELADVTAVEVTPEQVTVTTKTPEPAGPQASNPAEGAPMTAATATVQTPGLVATPPPATDQNALYAALVDAFSKGLSGRRLEAALSDIVPGDVLGIEQPQYVGEMWSGSDYERRFIPLFNHRDLTSFSIKGWKWTDGKRPEVDLYAGNKADIPSGDVETEETNGVLQRFAGGHDIDRKFRDFSSAEFWAAYFKALTTSYAKKSDRYVRDVAKAVPTVANGGRVHLLNAAMPSGVPKALAMITKGALKLLNSDLEVMPTFAMVSASYWEELMYVPQDDVLAYLSTTLGLDGGTVSGFKLLPVPDASLYVGSWHAEVLVGHRNALDVHELPGTPIRVEAEAVSKGGIDEALFGYVGTMVENALGLVAYDAPTAS